MNVALPAILIDAVHAIGTMLEEVALTYGVHTFVAVLKQQNFRSMGLLNRLGFEPATAEQADAYEYEADEGVLLKAAPNQPSLDFSHRNAP